MTTTYRGTTAVDVNVFVQTAETQLGAKSKYTYYYSMTPLITKVDHAVWATSTSTITGCPTSADSSAFVIKIDNQFADLGEIGELNKESFSTTYSRNDNVIYFRPPTDIVAGFRNISWNVQNPSSSSSGPGLAETFDDYYPLDLKADLTYKYYYDTTFLGTTFSVYVLPTISSISTQVGSIAGGTRLIVKGHGFSPDSIVFAGGELCQVEQVTVDSLTCITSPHRDTLVTDPTKLAVFSDTIQTGGKSITLNSTRPYGSAGAWFKLWKRSDPNYGKDSSALLSVPWRTDGTFISMYSGYGGSTWNTNIGLSYSSITFDAELRTNLIAPVSGNYSFYLVADDYATLYGGAKSVVLAKLTSYLPAYDFWKQSTQISRPVYLTKGDVYPLRLTTVSEYFF